MRKLRYQEVRNIPKVAEFMVLVTAGGCLVQLRRASITPGIAERNPAHLPRGMLTPGPWTRLWAGDGMLCLGAHEAQREDLTPVQVLALVTGTYL